MGVSCVFKQEGKFAKRREPLSTLASLSRVCRSGQNFRFVVALALLELSIAAFASAQVNVLNVNYDSQQTGANVQETTLAPGMNWSSFGKLGTFPVDGQVFAQPLYVTGVVIGGVKYNVLYVVTMGDSVYAFNADTPQSTTPLWRVNLGQPVPSGLFNPVPGGLSNYTDILPEIGILSTPAIDPNAQVIYVVSDTLPAGAPSTPVFQLHALSLVDGHEMLGGPVQIAASVSGNGLDSNNGTIPFYAIEELQRPGLMLANGTIYIAFGSHGDTGPYHGWMLGYNASTLQQTAVFNSTPNGRQSAIWQTGRAPAADANGNIYAVTANGDWDGIANFGQSVLRLSGADLSLLDWYTPSDWESLDGMDADIGTTGAILIPNTNYLVSGSKAAVLFLIQDDALGHLGAATTQGVQVNSYGLFDIALWGNLTNAPASSVANAHAAAAVPSSILYEFEPAGPLKAFQIANNQINSTILSEFTPPFVSEYAGLSISANGAADGIVWLTLANYGAAGLPGTLFALDATNLASVLWSSDMNSSRDQLGAFAKFAPPTVANGRVFVPTFSRTVVVYGLLSGATPPGNPTITSVVNGASYLAGGVSPGELVTIFGANLGSPLEAQGSLIGNKVADSIDSTQVLFGGVASPLLFASPTQINAVVPFGVTGTTTEVQIAYQGQPTVSTTVPVQAASPALFSLQSNGGGSGAILNQDGSVNSRGNPAARGSVVVLYGTGGGLTTPASVDGLLTSQPYPAPNLPVSVFVDTLPAQVLYAGAAPGIVAGVMQINVVVPANASVAPFDQVDVTIGGYQSPTTVSVAVK
jgi:uncharacterized protein (TIGR03437 family)